MGENLSKISDDIYARSFRPKKSFVESIPGRRKSWRGESAETERTVPNLFARKKLVQSLFPKRRIPKWNFLEFVVFEDDGIGHLNVC
jgi:hypothetical protein